MAEAEQRYEATQQAARVFKDFRYRTLKSWSCERRVIAKAEHLAKGENPRFVVTSLSAEQWPARALYEDLYCARGDMPADVAGGTPKLQTTLNNFRWQAHCRGLYQLPAAA